MCNSPDKLLAELLIAEQFPIACVMCRARWMSRAAVDDYANAASRCGSRARAASRTDGARRSTESAGVTEFQLSNRAHLLGDPKNGVSYTWRCSLRNIRWIPCKR